MIVEVLAAGVVTAAAIAASVVVVSVQKRCRLAVERATAQTATLQRELTKTRREAEAREAALRTSNQSLAASNEDLTAKNRQLEKLGQRRGAIVATLSRDLRSPLTSILNLSTLMMEGRAGSLGSEPHKYVDLMHGAARRLLGMINDILDLSRIDAGRADLDVEVVDLEPALWAIVQANWSEARRKDVVIRLDARGPLPPVLCDKERLRQVLTTLVRNGVRFTDQGHVEIVAEARGSLVTVEVTDTGVGIPEPAAGHIFQDFWEINADSRRSGSTVLGLAIARRLIELMGGDLSVASAPGKGSSFTFTLPAAGDAPRRAATPVRRRSETPTGRYLSAEVLVIDDDDLDRADAMRALQAAGFEAFGASSGKEGLRLLAERPFHAVVLDLVMPDMNGLDVLTQVGRDERLSSIPFVVLSSMYMTKMEREVLGPSVVAMVLKGATARDDLVPAVQTALGADGIPPFASVLVVEPDPASRRTLEDVLGALPVSVVSAESEPEALLACRRRARDLVIVDLDGPGDLGPQTIAAVRGVPGCESAYMVGLVSADGDAHRARLRDAGVHEYLKKPVRPLNAVTLLTRLLDARERVKPAAAQA